MLFCVARPRMFQDHTDIASRKKWRWKVEGEHLPVYLVPSSLAAPAAERAGGKSAICSGWEAASAGEEKRVKMGSSEQPLLQSPLSKAWWPLPQPDEQLWRLCMARVRQTHMQSVRDSQRMGGRGVLTSQGQTASWGKPWDLSRDLGKMFRLRQQRVSRLSVKCEQCRSYFRWRRWFWGGMHEFRLGMRGRGQNQVSCGASSSWAWLNSKTKATRKHWFIYLFVSNKGKDIESGA